MARAEEHSEGPSMNANDFAQVPDLDNQCNNSFSAAAGSHRLPSARHLQANEMNNLFSQFTPQAPYLGQEGDDPLPRLHLLHSLFCISNPPPSDDLWLSPEPIIHETLPLTIPRSLFITRFLQSTLRCEPCRSILHKAPPKSTRTLFP